MDIDDDRGSQLATWWQPTSMHREMSFAGGALYTSGGVLVLLTLLLSSAEAKHPAWVIGVGITATAVGLFYLWATNRLPMPLWLYAVATSLGAVLVTIAAAGGAAEQTATYGVLYVFVTTYGFYYYPLPVAVWLMVLNGTGFWLVLTRQGVIDPLPQWLMIVGAAMIAGGLIGTLGQRVRRLYRLEQDNVESLNELGEWKTTFLRAAAHDLRSPLGALITGLKTLREHDAEVSVDQRREILNRSIDSGERLNRLVTDLLDIERIEAGDITARLEDTALDQLVQATVAQVNPWGRRIDVETSPVLARVEPAKIERIVENLVRNAVTHTPDDSHVTVRLEAMNGHAVLTVEDNGPGLAPSVLTHLFEAFAGRAAATPAAGESIGLGLHLVAQFAKLHHGTVVASNVAGGGARFVVRLPTGQPSVPQPAGRRHGRSEGVGA